jgi:flagellum-specific ATP synthase
MSVEVENPQSAIRDPQPADAFVGRLVARLESVEPLRRTGRVAQVAGLVIESTGPAAVVGEVCAIHPPSGPPVRAEVVGFRGPRMLLMPLDDVGGIGPGCRVVATGQPLAVPVGPELLGRVLDCLGSPVDGRGPLACTERRPILAAAPPPMSRPRIHEALATGVRAIDGFLTLGRGQRVGIFSGSGVGKSVLMGQIARSSAADVTVVGLVGERGREVREFLDKNLGEEGLKRSIVVAVTSDDLALRRIKGAFTATTIAEYFRDRGLNVLLFIDSITRFAYAQRELGLSIGEPPATRGYTPSVFAALPRLLERAGNAARGSITGIYNVLVEGDDLDEPVADAARSILDGHIVLSRELTLRGHYPAIDILQSLSRLMPDVADPDHQRAASTVRRVYAAYRHSEDLIRLGAYVRGTSAELDLAVSMVGEIDNYLRQPVGERVAFRDSIERLVHTLAAKIPRTG